MTITYGTATCDCPTDWLVIKAVIKTVPWWRRVAVIEDGTVLIRGFKWKVRKFVTAQLKAGGRAVRSSTMPFAGPSSSSLAGIKLPSILRRR